MGADDLLEQLRREGELVADGSFELDREKAREKLQQFQLRDPHHYVLHLVQAAHLLESKRIDFDIDADEMEMRVDDTSLTRADLEGLYDAALSDRTDQKTSALRHLAIALTAARELELAEVRVEVTNGGQTTALVRTDDEFIEQLETPDRDDGTRVYLREALSASHVGEFFRNLAGSLDEESALRDHCRFSTREISLDGKTISFGHRLPDEAVGEMAIETDHEHGVLGLVPRDEEVRVIILQNGVKIVEHIMEARLCGARAIIESDRLTMNLSQSAFIEDENWEHLIEDLLPAALDAALQRYFHTMDQPFGKSDRNWLQDLSARVFSQNYDVQQPDFTELNLDPPTGEMPIGERPSIDKILRSLPLWRRVDPSTTSTPEEFIALDAFDKPVHYTRQFQRDVPLESVPPALYFPSGLPSHLKFAVGARFIDLTRKYKRAYKAVSAREQARANNIRAWKLRSLNVRAFDDGPGSVSYPFQERFGATAINATLALARWPLKRAMLKLVKEGYLFREYWFDRHAGKPLLHGDALPPGLVIWFGGDLPVNRAFDAIEPNAEFIAVAKELTAALPGFIAAHAHRFRPPHLHRYLAHFLTGKIDPMLCKSFGIPRPGQWLSKVARDQPDSPWALVHHLQEQCHWAGLTPDEAVERVDQLGELAAISLFETPDGEEINLRMLAEIYARDGQLSVVVGGDEADEPRAPEDKCASQIHLEKLDRYGQIALEKLFGKPSG